MMHKQVSTLSNQPQNVSGAYIERLCLGARTSSALSIGRCAHARCKHGWGFGISLSPGPLPLRNVSLLVFLNHQKTDYITTTSKFLRQSSRVCKVSNLEMAIPIGLYIAISHNQCSGSRICPPKQISWLTSQAASRDHFIRARLGKESGSASAGQWSDLPRSTG